MSLNWFIGVVCAAMWSSAVIAQNTVQNVTVEEMAINRSYGNFVFIRVSTAPTQKASCSQQYWHYTLTLSDVAGREIYSMLLTAMASGKRVKLVGANACNEHGHIESLIGANIESS